MHRERSYNYSTVVVRSFSAHPVLLKEAVAPFNLGKNAHIEYGEYKERDGISPRAKCSVLLKEKYCKSLSIIVCKYIVRAYM